MFISTTPEFLRAVHISVQHYLKGYDNIQISVISVESALSSHHDISNAGDIVRALGNEDHRKGRNEWLFLGRIKRSAIMYTINLMPQLVENMYNLLPCLMTCATLNLSGLGEKIKNNFQIWDQYLFDEVDKESSMARKVATAAQDLYLASEPPDARLDFLTAEEITK